MALVIGLYEGDSFYVNDRKVTCSKIKGRHEYQLMISTDWSDQRYDISADKRVEILPKVFCSAGSTPTKSQVRVLIEAPREIKILRAVHYLKEHPEAS